MQHSLQIIYFWIQFNKKISSIKNVFVWLSVCSLHKNQFGVFSPAVHSVSGSCWFVPLLAFYSFSVGKKYMGVASFCHSHPFTPCSCTARIPCYVKVLISPCCWKVGHLSMHMHVPSFLSRSLTLRGSVCSNRRASNPSRLPIPLM